jgi:hypothetical protein
MEQPVEQRGAPSHLLQPYFMKTQPGAITTPNGRLATT